MNQITDASADKAEGFMIYILIYAFIYKNRHMFACLKFIKHALLISISACINKQQKQA